MSSKVHKSKKKPNINKLMSQLAGLSFDNKSKDSKRIEKIFDRLEKKESEEKSKYERMIEICSKNPSTFMNEMKYAGNRKLFIKKMEEKIKGIELLEKELNKAFMEIEDEEMLGALGGLKISKKRKRSSPKKKKKISSIKKLEKLMKGTKV
jgi:hypothetical protein